MTPPEINRPVVDRKALEEFVSGDPRLEAIREATGGSSVWLVGGSVRDLLIGRQPADLDLVTEDDPRTLAEGLDPEATIHDRFMTATALLATGPVDLARARTERYREPGALPEVEAASIEQDLGRRDFTINAIAVPLANPDQLVDPFGGIEALSEARLSLLHEDSFGDDPIRALRGARYAARFDFEPDRVMIEALRTVDFETVSEDRLLAEIRRFGEEPDPAKALELARGWGLVQIPEAFPVAVGRALELVEAGPWESFAAPSDLVETAIIAADQVEGFPAEPPLSRIEQRDLIKATSPAVLVLARVNGRPWLDWWPETGSRIGLEIDGDDLVAAGIEPGPRVGAGLRAALAEALEEGGTTRDRQIETARGVALSHRDG